MSLQVQQRGEDAAKDAGKIWVQMKIIQEQNKIDFQVRMKKHYTFPSYDESHNKDKVFEHMQIYLPFNISSQHLQQIKDANEMILLSIQKLIDPKCENCNRIFMMLKHTSHSHVSLIQKNLNDFISAAEVEGMLKYENFYHTNPIMELYMENVRFITKFQVAGVEKIKEEYENKCLGEKNELEKKMKKMRKSYEEEIKNMKYFLNWHKQALLELSISSHQLQKQVAKLKHQILVLKKQTYYQSESTQGIGFI